MSAFSAFEFLVKKKKTENTTVNILQRRKFTKDRQTERKADKPSFLYWIKTLDKQNKHPQKAKELKRITESRLFELFADPGNMRVVSAWK